MDKHVNVKIDTKIKPKITNKHKHYCCFNCEKTFAKKLHEHPTVSGGKVCDECRHIIWSWMF